MINKSRLLLGLLMATPGLAHALGLGDIRLGSTLNQPLAAEIELVGATPEELAQLRAQLASAEAFARYGLDRPQYLAGLSFRVAKDAAGGNVLEVRSNQAITEPFVTLLVEVSWPRGRLIREYTVLLDPPVFEAQPTPAPAIAAPRTGETAAQAAGVVERPAALAPRPTTPSAPATTSPTAPSPAATLAGGEYRVASGDTLTSIARRYGASTRSEIDRLMIAIYRANPQAFAGNINRLNRGAVLSIPGAGELAELSAADATREVRRQMSEWRGARTEAATADTGRLRLVTPAEGIGETGIAPAPAAAPAPDAGAATGAAGQASADQRLLELRNQELARLQGQQAPATAPAPAPAAETPPVATDPAAEGAEPAGATPPAESAPAAAPAPTRPAAQPAAASTEPGLLQTLTDNLLYLVLAGAALLLAGLLGFKFLQRRREAEVDEALRTLDRGSGDDAGAPVLSSTARIARESAVPARDTFVVEESDDDSGEYSRPPGARPAPAPVAAPMRAAAEPRSLDDTLSSETPVGLDQADALAEADFHMAYGLYDQAADIVKLAMGREPGRRDLQLKLLEVYFVWGNKDAFLDVARELGRSRDEGIEGEWDKVSIMGRQIAPEDPLFAGALVRTAAVDVDLDAGGSPGVDLELLGDDVPVPRTAARGGDVDLDLGQALGAGDSNADTGASPVLDADSLDFDFDDAPPSGNTTRELAPRLDSPTLEQPIFGGTTREMAPRFDSPTMEQPVLRAPSADSPTVESPALRVEADPIRGKLDSALQRRGEAVPESTQELSLDDLGFDVDSLSTTGTALQAPHLPDEDADAPTMVAGLDDRSRQMLRDAEERQARTLPDLEKTQLAPGARPRFEDELTQVAPRFGGDERTERLSLDPGTTGSVRVIGAGAGADLDLDLDELAKALENDTVNQPRRDDLGFASEVFGRQGANGAAKRDLDLDVGAPLLADDRAPTATERMNLDELALPELEPVTLSEVGTKLDLARAYMDMGDPDGARSILQEVLSEGSASQKLEAQRLIETLPG